MICEMYCHKNEVMAILDMLHHLCSFTNAVCVCVCFGGGGCSITLYIVEHIDAKVLAALSNEILVLHILCVCVCVGLGG